MAINNYSKVRKRIYEILTLASPEDKESARVNSFILIVIVLNILFLILETVESINEIVPRFFAVFELLSILIFTVEYGLGIWSYGAGSQAGEKQVSLFRYILSPLLVIDLLAILPFYLPFLLVDLRFLRAIRLMRFFRIAKIGRYSKTLQTFGRVMLRVREQLVTALILLLLLLLISSSAMYFAENTAQPDQFPSIPAAMWWGIVSLTTVGYGDVFPVTASGKIIASIIAVLGIGVFALPTGILGAAFVHEIQHVKEKHTPCAKCGYVDEG